MTSVSHQLANLRPSQIDLALANGLVPYVTEKVIEFTGINADDEYLYIVEVLDTKPPANDLVEVRPERRLLAVKVDVEQMIITARIYN